MSVQEIYIFISNRVLETTESSFSHLIPSCEEGGANQVWGPLILVWFGLFFSPIKAA